MPTLPTAPPILATDPEAPLADELLLDIALGLAGARPLWEGRVHRHADSRHAVRLLASDRYEAWVIGWPPDHSTATHDHGTSAGALVVVEGTLVERAGPARSRVRTLDVGAAIALPAGLVHDVGTTGSAATSLHVYSPPLSTMTFYEDGTGLPDRVVTVEPEVPAVDARTLSALLHPAGRGRRG